MSRRRSGIVALLLLGAASLASGAHGEESPANPSSSSAPSSVSESGDTIEARDAFRLGSSLAKQGQWLDALAAFQRSAHLKPHPVTTFNVGYCERALGHPARAYEQFSAALRPAPTSDGPALPLDLAVEAQTYLAEAEHRIARVKVALPGPDLTMKVDGLSVGPMDDVKAGIFAVAAGGDAPSRSLPRTFELWLDPGTHVFILIHADGSKVVESRTLEMGASATMEFAPQPVTPVARPVPASQPGETAAPRHHAGPNHTPAYIAFGVGAAGLVAGGIFGGLALSEKSALASDPNCAGKNCPDEPSYRDKESRMVRFADFATVGLAVGVVGGALGTYFWVTAKDAGDGAKVRRASAVEPWIGLRSAGVRGKF